MDKQAYMFGLIEERKISGLSKRAFCRNRGIAPGNFFYRIKKWKNEKEEVPDGFVAITLNKVDNFQSPVSVRYSLLVVFEMRSE